jgi:hypothetical protein
VGVRVGLPHMIPSDDTLTVEGKDSQLQGPSAPFNLSPSTTYAMCTGSNCPIVTAYPGRRLPAVVPGFQLISTGTSTTQHVLGSSYLAKLISTSAITVIVADGY